MGNSAANASALKVHRGIEHTVLHGLWCPFKLNVFRFPKTNAHFWLYVPSFPGKAGKVFTWNGRKGLPSWRGISSLSSELTRTSTWDSEMEDVNWSMSVRCSWSSSSVRVNKQPGRRVRGGRNCFLYCMWLLELLIASRITIFAPQNAVVPSGCLL